MSCVHSSVQLHIHTCDCKQWSPALSERSPGCSRTRRHEAASRTAPPESFRTETPGPGLWRSCDLCYIHELCFHVSARSSAVSVPPRYVFIITLTLERVTNDTSPVRQEEELTKSNTNIYQLLHHNHNLLLFIWICLTILLSEFMNVFMYYCAKCKGKRNR